MHIDEFLERLEPRIYDVVEAEHLAREAWLAGLAYARSLVLTHKLRFDAMTDQAEAKAADIIKRTLPELEKDI